MPKESSLDKFLLLFVTAVFTISSLSAVFFSYQIYDTNKKIAKAEPENLLVLQGKQKDTGEVLAGCGADWCYAIRVKDSSSNDGIVSALVTLNSPRDVWTGCTIGDGGNWTFEYQSSWFGPGDGGYAISCSLKPGEALPTQVNITASKSGYQTKTTNVSTVSGTVSLTKESSPSNSNQTDAPSGSPTTSTDTTTQTTVAADETITDVSLPSTFTKEGSKTTDLSKIADLKKVKSFTLEVVGKNKVVFTDPLNLSSEKLVSKFKDLGKFVKMGQEGKVEIDSKNLAALNKKATITMSNLKFVTKPEVLVDGVKDKEKIVSNLTYNKEKGTLIFNVAHFTSLWAVPKLELTSPDLGKITQQQNFIKGTISDPTTTITGRLNEVDLATYAPNETTGEFTIENISFQEGENFLTLEAKSEIYKILPLVTTITYSPVAAAATATEQNQTHYILLLVSLIGALIFIILLGYLVYRKRKYFLKADSSSKTAQVYHA